MEPQKKYPELLKQEVEAELATIDKDIDFLNLKLENINNRYHTCNKLLKANRLRDSDKEVMRGCWEDAERFSAEIRRLEKRKEQIAQQRKQVIERDADKLFEEARQVEAKTGKNKLYIGNRQFVALHADSKKGSQKKANARRRLLNANNWTWGVNFAWIEGGTTAGARIKIKENENNPNDYESIPEGAYEAMMINPRMTAKQWLELCREYPNTMLWHGGEDRPTWTALEIEACLNAGYQFAFREHRHREGRVIELVKR